MAEVFHIIPFALQDLSVNCSETKHLYKSSFVLCVTFISVYLVKLYKLKFMVGVSNYFTIGFPWLNNFAEYLNSEKICCRCQLFWEPLCGRVLVESNQPKITLIFIFQSQVLHLKVHKLKFMKYHRCSVETENVGYIFDIIYWYYGT